MTKAVGAAALALLLLLAYLTAIRPAFDLAYCLALLFGVAFFWPRTVARRIRVTRTLDAGIPTVGESFEERFEVRNGSHLPAPWVEVMDLGSIEGYRPGRVVSLGRRSVAWVARGIYPRRGWTTFGPTSVRVREPFGIFAVSARLPDRHRVLVYPRVRVLPDLSMSEAQHAGSAPRFGAWADYPPDTAGVREYANGDSFGRIHWPLSMKHGSLMSKTFEQPLTADLWIVLDLDSRCGHGTGDESTLEYAISLAASVAMQVQARGRLVGLIANDGKQTVLEPHRAVRQDRVLLDYLAIAGGDGRVPLADAGVWNRLRELPKRAVAVITASPDPRWMNSLRAVRGRNATLLAFYIDAASFGAPEPETGFDLGSEVDMYVVRKGDDFSRLVRTRDAVRLG